MALLNFMPGNVGKTNQKLSVELSTIKYVNCKTLKIYKWTEFYPGLFACKPGQHNFSLYKICNRGFLLALPGGLRQNCTDAVWFNPLFLSLFLLWPRKGLSVCLLRPVSHKRLEAPPPLVYPLCGGWGGGGGGGAEDGSRQDASVLLSAIKTSCAEFVCVFGGSVSVTVFLTTVFLP